MESAVNLVASNRFRMPAGLARCHTVGAAMMIAGALASPAFANTLTAAQQSDLLVFLKAIDGTTPPFRSEGDDFRDTIRLLGPCP